MPTSPAFRVTAIRSRRPNAATQSPRHISRISSFFFAARSPTTSGPIPTYRYHLTVYPAEIKRKPTMTLNHDTALYTPVARISETHIHPFSSPFRRTRYTRRNQFSPRLEALRVKQAPHSCNITHVLILHPSLLSFLKLHLALSNLQIPIVSHLPTLSSSTSPTGPLFASISHPTNNTHRIPLSKNPPTTPQACPKRIHISLFPFI